MPELHRPGIPEESHEGDATEDEDTPDKPPREEGPEGLGDEARSRDGAEISTEADTDPPGVADRTRVGPDSDRRLQLPAGASAEEASAIAAAVATHLEGGAGAEGEEDSALDSWKLAGRLQSGSSLRPPRTLPRGGAWKAASRCR